ncbi:type I pullulanase [Caldalkalibacillus mannanilyticus]|uniref:type I pullulanase n=1 Tax=Caldalkalibacillus mannanilyticus TaxID=1418 RepID=UPI000469E746|nr:type I pullulanase [Caldalkalibacillus mannanilyticus]
MEHQKDIDEKISFGGSEVVQGMQVHSTEFDLEYYYDGADLGSHYSNKRTSFRLWAPTANEARVVLYQTWDGPPLEEMTMMRAEKGTWILQVEKDLHGMLYTYKVLIGEQWNEAIDPYAKAVSVNGDRAAIIDMKLTTPERWTTDKPPFDSPVDAIIYELHIRDVSMHPESGIQHKGKFLGLIEEGRKGPQGISTGLDYLKQLGVTHVQLLPIFDFATESVDETKPDQEQYNWGYDPKNYQVPEGSYSTDPFDPVIRIKEMKQMIQTLHEHGIRVIMDVVFNHVYNPLQTFEKLVPGYYFRYWEDGELCNGSGCGNDIASERWMVRKYIVDTIKYFVQEYHVDGFRFDLMGLHDIETMNQVRQTLDEIDPSIIVIGEGWDLHTNLPSEERANQHNAAQMKHIAHFNDRIRDALKGVSHNHHDKGFVSGNHWKEFEVKKGIAGAIAYHETLQSFADEPTQTVTYVEAHDDHTLWDQLKIINAHEDEDVLKRMHLLATAIVLTSQGICFLHAGQEFLRTKGGERNSYRSPTSVNQLDWSRCAQHFDIVQSVQKLIAIRKKHPAFRMRTAEQIRAHLFFEQAPQGCLAYTIRNHANGDSAKILYIGHNANSFSREFILPQNTGWDILYGLREIEQKRENQQKEFIIKLAPYSSMILASS